MKPLEQQIERMRRRWPKFVCKQVDNTQALWFGSLRPVERQYEIAIRYGYPIPASIDTYVRRYVRGLSPAEWHRLIPVVRVISPPLKLRHDAAEEGPLPHVFLDSACPQLSPLCLFDPARNEWTHNDFLADTTVPWTAEWLACYEGWRVTGNWYGGGRAANAGVFNV